MTPPSGSTRGGGGELSRYVREHRDLLADVLSAGSAEAKAYALALLSEAGTAEDLEQARQALDDLEAGGSA